jgi:hypothetical protein
MEDTHCLGQLQCLIKNLQQNSAASKGREYVAHDDVYVHIQAFFSFYDK